MGIVEHSRIVITRGEGVWVWDDAGERYLDGTAALWYSNLGHGRGEIEEAVARQLRTLDAYSTFGDFANEPALELADRLAELASVPGSRVFLGSGGGDMIESAAKIARSYHAHQGNDERVHLIGRVGGYHGTRSRDEPRRHLCERRGIRSARPRCLAGPVRRPAGARG